jgi:hypothetical protein
MVFTMANQNFDVHCDFGASHLVTLIENMSFWLMLDLLPFKVDGQSAHLNNKVVNVLESSQL